VVYVLRHGETEWSATGRHTGVTDVPLTVDGEQQARRAGLVLSQLRGTNVPPALVLCSPRQRAVRTAELAGLHVDEVTDELAEWDYGQYEGLTTAEIRHLRPGWDLFRDGCPGGESVKDVGDRADGVIARLRAIEGRTILFGHSHFFRVLAARWLGLTPGDGRFFLMCTAALSVLGYEHSRDEPAIQLWNDDRHVRA
jgi:probable phosphoglycerate mutase